jgi:hypothetical protein
MKISNPTARPSEEKVAPVVEGLDETHGDGGLARQDFYMLGKK